MLRPLCEKSLIGWSRAERRRLFYKRAEVLLGLVWSGRQGCSLSQPLDLSAALARRRRRPFFKSNLDERREFLFVRI